MARGVELEKYFGQQYDYLLGGGNSIVKKSINSPQTAAPSHLLTNREYLKLLQRS